MKIKKKLVSLTFLSIVLLMSSGLFFTLATPSGNEAGDLDRDRIRDQDRTKDGDCDQDCLCDGPGDCECNCHGPSDDEGPAGPGEGDGDGNDNDPGLLRKQWRYTWIWGPRPN